MLTYPWKCTVLHCNHLGNTWKPLVLNTRHFDYCLSASKGDNQSVRSSAPVVSRCFPGGYNVKLYISRGRLAWWLLAFFAQCTIPGLFSDCRQNNGLKPWQLPNKWQNNGYCNAVSQHKKTTIHQLTTVLSISNNVLFPGRNHLLTTGADDPSLAGAQVIIKVLDHQHQWLVGGYDLELGHFQRWIAWWLAGGQWLYCPMYPAVFMFCGHTTRAVKMSHERGGLPNL